ncbi:MAG: hypothetical protein HQ513_12940 [Rhodospirillales bacterium]|nr:hypothetical protein [Rhodospirillales bacterium]
MSNARTEPLAKAYANETDEALFSDLMHSIVRDFVVSAQAQAKISECEKALRMEAEKNPDQGVSLTAS